MIQGTITLGVQKGLNALRDDKQGQWLKAKVAGPWMAGSRDYQYSIPTANSVMLLSPEMRSRPALRLKFKSLRAHEPSPPGAG
jgi:hypothetical protein